MRSVPRSAARDSSASPTGRPAEPNQIRFCPLGVELAEDGQIGIVGVQRSIGVGTFRDFAPLGGQPVNTGRMVEGFAHVDGRTARPFPKFPENGSSSVGS